MSLDAIGLGEFYALAAALAWSVAVLGFRLSGEQLGPFALNLFKNVLLFVLVAPTIVLMHGAVWPEIALSAWIIMLVSGLIGIGLADTFFFRALNQLGPSRTAIGSMLLSPFVIVCSYIYLGERLTLWQIAGAGLTLVGVALVNWRRTHALEPARADRSGVLALVAAMALMAVGIVMVKPLLETEPFLWVVEIRVVGGLAGMLVLGLMERRIGALTREFRQARRWPITVGASFMGTYVAMLLWLAGYKFADASIAAVLNETSAVFVIILAAVFLRERLNARQWLGSVVAGAGVVIVVTG